MSETDYNGVRPERYDDNLMKKTGHFNPKVSEQMIRFNFDLKICEVHVGNQL